MLAAGNRSSISLPRGTTYHLTPILTISYGSSQMMRLKETGPTFLFPLCGIVGTCSAVLSFYFQQSFYSQQTVHAIYGSRHMAWQSVTIAYD